MALSTTVDIVDVNDTAEGCSIVALFNDLSQFVLDPPRGQIVDTQMTFERQHRDSVLLLCQKKHRQEPGRDRQLGGFREFRPSARLDGGSGGTAKAPVCASALARAGDRKSVR